MAENDKTYVGNEKDPTLNVRELLDDAVESIKDLFKSEIRRVDERHEALTKQMQERFVAESKRLDAIREVDAAAVRVANDKALETAAVLAGQVSTSAETLRALVAANAATVALNMQQQGAQLAVRIDEGQKNQDRRDDVMLKRIDAVEKAQNVSQGRSGVSMPLLLALVGILSAIIGAIINSFIR